MKKPLPTHGFTLMEILVVIAIIGVLAALIVPVSESVRKRGNQTAALSNIRQIGAAILMFAGEHDYQIPGRAEGGESGVKWPKVLSSYLKDLRVYAAPGDLQNYLNRGVDPLSNAVNNTSFIMNGYNDLGTMADPSVEIRMNRFESSSNTILLGTPKAGSTHFYMDFLEPPHGNQVDVLNLTAYGDGSNYGFADGSARFISKAAYDHTLWLVNKSFEIPNL